MEKLSADPMRVFLSKSAALWTAGLIACMALLSQQPLITELLAKAYLFWGYICAGLILGAIALLFHVRHKAPVLGLLLALALAFCWPWARDLALNGAEDGRPKLKIIAYNWLADPHDRAPALAWLDNERPDVLMIAEYHENTPGVGDRLYRMFPFHTKPRGDVILLSRFPIKEESRVDFGDRQSSFAILDVNGRPLEICAIHPQTLRTYREVAERNAYLADVASYVGKAQIPLVMLGDFNATRWDPVFMHVALKDRLHEEPRFIPLATRVGVRSGLTFIGSPIDHILSNSGNRLSGCRTGPLLGSDHRPLICELQLAPS